MPERVPEKRKASKRKLGVDWWAVIVAIAVLVIIKLGIVRSIPW